MESTPSNAGALGDIRCFEGALPEALFDRLVRAVRAVGRRRLKRNYTTTFWFSRDASPGNVAEECVQVLARHAAPGDSCVGIEWWLGRLARGEKLRYHFDRDMKLRQITGQLVHPMMASVLYLNAFPSSPTVVLDQIASPDGSSRIPPKPERREKVPAVPNRYLVFPGGLRHGVIPQKDSSSREAEGDPGELRLTLLVNYWNRRPLPPLCKEYDGSVYPSLRD